MDNPLDGYQFDILIQVQPPTPTDVPSQNPSTARQTRSWPKPICLICLEGPAQTDTWVMPTALCKHGLVVCTSCFRQYIEHKILEEGSAMLVCLVTECRRALEPKDITKRIRGNIACLGRYNTLVTQANRERHPNFVWCTNSSCGHGQIHKEGSATPLVICEHCHARSCFTHQIPWHSSLTCSQYTFTTKHKPENLASEKFIARHTKQCPNSVCRRPILKSDGCDHMTCRLPGGCGHEFCWACLADYGPIRRRGNHHHKPNCPHYAGPGRSALAPPVLGRSLRVQHRVSSPNRIPDPRPSFPVPPAPPELSVRALPVRHVPVALLTAPTPRFTTTTPTSSPQLLPMIPFPTINTPQPVQFLNQPTINSNLPHRPTPPPVPVLSVSERESLPVPEPPSVATWPPRCRARRTPYLIKKVRPFNKTRNNLAIISPIKWWCLIYVLVVVVGVVIRTKGKHCSLIN